MVSISTGELRIDGNVARYDLRMPLYEVETLDDPRASIIGHFQLFSDGEKGSVQSASCKVVEQEDSYHCRIEYRFSLPVEQLSVECRYYAVTIPDHVHILRACRGETVEQAVFDFTAPRAELNFAPPTWWATASGETVAGVKRAAGGLASLLCLCALALAARSRRELLALAGMFVGGEVLAAVLLPLTNWQPAPRFVEAAAALTIAYLAVEILVLPQAGQRWLVVGVLGLFHGLYLGSFLQGTGYSAWYVLFGAAVADAVLVAISALLLHGVIRVLGATKTAQLFSVLLLAFGLGWFWMRLKG